MAEKGHKGGEKIFGFIPAPENETLRTLEKWGVVGVVGLMAIGAIGLL